MRASAEGMVECSGLHRPPRRRHSAGDDAGGVDAAIGGDRIRLAELISRG